jgi:hypothetical protein
MYHKPMNGCLRSWMPVVIVLGMASIQLPAQPLLGLAVNETSGGSGKDIGRFISAAKTAGARVFFRG